MSTGSATIVIDRPPLEVWAAVADITRMGEFSPECVSGRWVGGATGPAVGARFEGDNVAKLAGRTVKTWTTTSEVTACEFGQVFAFVAEAMTTWTYRFETVGAAGTSTQVTETFGYEPTGAMGFVYERILQRRKMMTKGMQRTLERLKTAVEA